MLPEPTGIDCSIPNPSREQPAGGGGALRRSRTTPACRVVKSSEPESLKLNRLPSSSSDSRRPLRSVIETRWYCKPSEAVHSESAKRLRDRGRVKLIPAPVRTMRGRSSLGNLTSRSPPSKITLIDRLLKRLAVKEVR